MIATQHLLTTRIRHWAASMGFDQNNKIFDSNFLDCCEKILPHKGNEIILEIYSCLGFLMLILDDSLDNHWSMLDERLVSAEFKILIMALSNDFSAQNFHSDFSIPHFKPICLALNNIYLKLCYYHKNPNNFIEKFRIYLDYALKELSVRKHKIHLSLSEYFDLRVIAGGMDVSNEMAFALLDIDIPQNIRDLSIFRNLNNEANKALIIMNDLLSYDKEKDKECNNYINYLEHKDNKVDAMLMNYNICVDYFNYYKDILLKEYCHTQVEHLNRACEVIARQVQAHTDWALATSRYRQEKNYTFQKNESDKIKLFLEF